MVKDDLIVGRVTTAGAGVGMLALAVLITVQAVSEDGYIVIWVRRRLSVVENEEIRRVGLQSTGCLL